MIVQAGHALLEMGKEIKIDGVPSIVLLSADSEQTLKDNLNYVTECGIRCFPFIEPDIGDQMTAFATVPINKEQRKLLKHFKLVK